MDDRAEEWLMLVFEQIAGFIPAKSGRSWFRLLPTREQAIAVKRELVSRGIKFKCVKVLKNRHPPRPTPTPSATRSASAWKMRYKRK